MAFSTFSLLYLFPGHTPYVAYFLWHRLLAVVWELVTRVSCNYVFQDKICLNMNIARQRVNCKHPPDDCTAGGVVSRDRWNVTPAEPRTHKAHTPCLIYFDKHFVTHAQSIRKRTNFRVLSFAFLVTVETEHILAPFFCNCFLAIHRMWLISCMMDCWLYRGNYRVV